MAVEILTFDNFYACLAADTKPTNPSKKLLLEIDTGTWYIHNGSAWVTFSAPVAQDGWRLARIAAVTFVAGTTGATGWHAMFTVTGDVEFMFRAKATVTLDDAGNTATIDFGTENNTSGIALNDEVAGNWAAGEWLNRGNAYDPEVSNDNATVYAASEDIGYFITNEALTTGAIVAYVWWKPLSAGATLIAA